MSQARTLHLFLVQQLREARVQLGLISNTDERMGMCSILIRPRPHILSEMQYHSHGYNITGHRRLFSA